MSAARGNYLVTASIEGEQLGANALQRITGGCSDPDLLMRLVLNACAVDGLMIPPGPALRSAMRQIQKRLEAANAQS